MIFQSFRQDDKAKNIRRLYAKNTVKSWQKICESNPRLLDQHETNRPIANHLRSRPVRAPHSRSRGRGFESHFRRNSAFSLKRAFRFQLSSSRYDLKFSERDEKHQITIVPSIIMAFAANCSSIQWFCRRT